VEYAVASMTDLPQGSWCVVTNNASVTPDAVSDRLATLGIFLPASRIVTSAQGAASYLRGSGLDAGAEILVVGSPALHEALHSCGFNPLRMTSTLVPVVVQGFGPDVGWRDLAAACYAVNAGALWVATNLDTTLPTPDGFAPGNGSLIAAVSAATGKVPDVVVGKPEPRLFKQAADMMKSNRQVRDPEPGRQTIRYRWLGLY
jgi:glycerol 3-phosphatase-2